jgi:hypothetical protein
MSDHPTALGGTCDTRFDSLRELFTAKLESGEDLGASLALNIDGEMVVDLWSATDRRCGRVKRFSGSRSPRRIWRSFLLNEHEECLKRRSTPAHERNHQDRSGHRGRRFMTNGGSRSVRRTPPRGVVAGSRSQQQPRIV